MALIDTQDAVNAMYDLCESLDTENPHIDAIVDALEEIAPAQAMIKHPPQNGGNDGGGAQDDDLHEDTFLSMYVGLFRRGERVLPVYADSPEREKISAKFAAGN